MERKAMSKPPIKRNENRVPPGKAPLTSNRL